VFKSQDTALDQEQPSYIDQLLHGDALLEDIDNFVDVWHDAPDDSRIASLSLEEFLGMSSEEYRLWVERPESLRFIAAAHRNKQPVAAILGEEDRYGLAARAEDQGVAHELLRWLIERGRVQELPH
jgi:hypothetical protein